MAPRLTHDRRVATAALLLGLVVAAMLVVRARDVADDARSGPAHEVAPVGAGVTREVRNLSDWNQALAVAQPGDVIRLKATIGSRLAYQGGNDGGAGTAPSGTADLPIVITADPGVWIDPGNLSSGQGALDVTSADHVHVIGVNVRNAQFGIRCHQCHGSPGHPVRIASNQVTQVGHAGIHFAGHWQTHAPSWHGLIENNVVSHTGRGAPSYGEGIYLGYGSAEWVDTTSDVTVRGNDISFTTAEGVDIKPGTRNIVVESNRIHDLAPINGGAISAHYVNLVPNPRIGQVDQVVVRDNLIWNLNLGNVAGSNDWAIWVGHGGVDVIGNVIWGLRGDADRARAVRVRATQPFGPHPIRIQDNIMWTARGWVAEGQPSGAANVQASGNRGVDPGSVEIVVGAGAFAGPIPAIGAGGAADAGSGPGSAFQLAGGGPSPSPAPAPSPPPTSAPVPGPPPSPSPAPSPSPSPGAPPSAPVPAPAPTTPRKPGTGGVDPAGSPITPGPASPDAPIPERIDSGRHLPPGPSRRPPAPGVPSDPGPDGPGDQAGDVDSSGTSDADPAGSPLIGAGASGVAPPMLGFVLGATSAGTEAGASPNQVGSIPGPGSPSGGDGAPGPDPGTGTGGQPAGDGAQRWPGTGVTIGRGPAGFGLRIGDSLGVGVGWSSGRDQPDR